MTEVPIQWLANEHALENPKSKLAAELFPPGLPRKVLELHSSIPGYQTSPLKSLPHLARRIGLGGIWVKDESARLSLNSFKVLGGAYAIYKKLLERGSYKDNELSLRDLLQLEGKHREKLGHPVFVTATDGNHGTGVAWAANKMGFPAIIYVHSLTTKDRIRGIEQQGGKVVVVDGNYDDAVRQASFDAKENGWEVISDTAWEGYDQVPRWIMQGYATMFVEAQEQLSGQGLSRPTHLIVQAGVGSLAAAAIGYYSILFEDNVPLSMVVEPTKAACLYESMRIGDGKPHNVTGDLDTIMAGLACGDPNPLAWETLYNCADYFAICPDYVAAKGMRVYSTPLPGDPFIVSGESGAVTLGALMYTMEYEGARELCDAIGLNEDSQVLLINTEGNTSPDDFRSVVWEGGMPVPDEYKIHAKEAE
ncbi:MAG: diaminopropionate ammonia-lyase [Chloroflexi bacterium]|nr:diaminopropionate ammonia-lyase [Chloroflexota bacterium]